MRTNEAAQRRDEGIERAVDKADRDEWGWSDQAHYVVVRFCSAQGSGRHFMAEDVRDYAEVQGLLNKPENERAWGGVMRRAAALGLIAKAGYAPARSSNLSPKVLWVVK